MAEGSAIKNLTQRMASEHTQKGACLAFLYPPPKEAVGVVVVNMDKNPRCILDTKVNPKDIREYLWDRRKSRVLARKRAAVWTMRDPNGVTSWVGLAEWMDPQKAEFLALRGVHYRVLCGTGVSNETSVEGV